MERTEIIKLAARLGEGIRQNEVYAKYSAADIEYRKDNRLQAMIAEYSVQQEALSIESAKPEPDGTVVCAIKARMDELYGAITHSDVFESFMSAQGELRELLDEVNRTIMSQVNGTDPEDPENGGCTGNCASCGGCGR